LAKTTIPQATVKAPLIPRPTDPRAEAFYLLGKLAHTDEAPRLTEIIIEHMMMKPEASAE
jgi:hypothetical protein